MKKRKIMYVGLLSTMILTLAACGGGASKNDSKDKSASKGEEQVAAKQEFTVNVTQEMPSADLSLNTDVIGSVALNNVYEGIYRISKDQKPEPAGATEKAEVSEDGLTYKIKLREDAKWSDGKPVTAKDYVYGWQRTVDPKTQSEYAYLHEPVKNAAEITAGKKDKSELGIKAVSDYELEIQLEKATPYFDYLLAFTTYMPQREDIVEKYGKEYTTTSEKAVYNGPFKLADFDGPGTDTEWTYVKNDQYWDKETVKLDKINVSVVKEASTSLNLFESGKAEDVILTGELAQQKADDPEFVSEMKASSRYIELNQRDDKSEFKNEDLRKAISYAIDRESLANQILADGSVASKGLVPKDVAKSPKGGKDFTEEAGSELGYDSKKAKKHWEKAKKDLGKETIKVDLLASDTDSSKKAIEFLKGSLEEELPGLKVNLSPVPFSVRLDRSNKGDFSMVYGGWIADYPDPSSFLDLFTADNSYNRGRYSNPEYDKLIKDAGTTNVNDPEKRWEDMINAEKLITKEVGVVPLIQEAEAHLRSDKVKGVVSHPSGAMFDYKWAYKVD
ncbi:MULTISPECIES: peptide ABC transporter substrate-binding protein [Vagococcus]|uniref:Oligopeptide ABC transporter, periplasmic oligopeptide-binding protein OppA (TC 3.A.1.5.1) n=1 Tax=Vagococcus fluvialis bH819 TaxID=1255619 RepID=A0A1X6WLD3_9ENTE|nr:MULTISPECIES: peptide ABC transporter substrate-binding protein [Vagococcus]SLM84496.1 Oligopeptide ABC transporter, periplasmic oligopeptide-binding protein OppA (TC 3.A.1.5.1) [Vagococcus fluvialis bH819]HCM90534.1 peptide ABC transporter substrate-binding protein [Vagococcus sp.]